MWDQGIATLFSHVGPIGFDLSTQVLLTHAKGQEGHKLPGLSNALAGPGPQAHRGPLMRNKDKNQMGGINISIDGAVF